MRARLPLLAALLLASAIRAESGGKLAAFEASLDKPREEKPAPAPVRRERRDCDDDDDALLDENDECILLFDAAALIGIGALYGGMESLAAVAPEHWGLLEGIEYPRAPGSTLTPFLRVDSSYQSLDNNLDAVDIRAEAGFGPLGVTARRTWFDERGRTTGELQVNQLQFLYRMQFFGHLGVDVGGGPLVFDGANRRETVSWTTPVQFRFNEHFTAEFIPMWATFEGAPVRDYELSAVASWRNFGLKAGYRWMETDDQSLEAPLVGLSVRW